MGQACTRMPAKCDQLCRNRNRNLLGGDGADVESDGGVDLVEEMGGYAFLPQRFKDSNHFALGADHPDVAGAGLHGPAQQTHVVAMTAGDDDDVGSFVGIKLLRRLIEIKRMYFAGGREAFLGRVGGAVVGDDGVETCIRGHLTKICSYVTCAENIK